MAKGKEPTALICTRVRDMVAPPVQSRVGMCSQCRAAVWVALSSTPVDQFVCTRCAPAFLKAEQQRGKPVRFGGLTLDQMREIKRLFEGRKNG